MSKQVRLGEVEGLEFIGGQITSRIEAKKVEDVIGSMQVIVPKAIDKGKVDSKKLISIDCKKEPKKERLTQECDIVMKLSAPYDSVFITGEEEGLLVSSFCIIIRNDWSTILPNYLLAFCNSDYFMNQIKAKFTGAATPMATISMIQDTKINIYPKKQQKMIGDYYINMCKKEEIMRNIISLEKEKIDVLLGEQ